MAALRANADRLGLVWKFRYATVETASPLTIIFDADTVPVGAVSITGTTSVGARVGVIIVPGGLNLVMGLAPSEAGSPGRGIITYVDATSNSSAIGVTETVVLTAPTITYADDRVYKVTVSGNLLGSVANTANTFIRKDTTSGTLLGTHRSATLPTANSPTNLDIFLFCNRSGAPVSTSVVFSIQASSGTVTHVASIFDLRYMLIEDIGALSSEFANVISV